MPRSLVIIAYDTPSDRRRRRIARLADDFGSRIQRSVFEAWLDRRQREWLTARIRAEIDETEDSVYIASICARCEVEVERLGQTAATRIPRYWII